jgi:hypothetical protein
MKFDQEGSIATLDTLENSPKKLALKHFVLRC